MEHTVASCLRNTGQLCAALTRLLVPARLLGRAETLAVVAAARWPLGDPADPRAVLGPLTGAAQQARVRGDIPWRLPRPDHLHGYGRTCTSPRRRSSGRYCR